VYYDSKPCQVCGSEVELRAATPEDIPEPDGPVGPRDGYVGGGDPTVDTRICTNPDCPTNAGTADPDQQV
jgi:hypothetical protein